MKTDLYIYDELFVRSASLMWINRFASATIVAVIAADCLPMFTALSIVYVRRYMSFIIGI